MAVFLRKLLRIGGLPDELRAQVEAEGVVHLAEYLPVTRRFSGSVPGMRASGNISSYVGSLVFTPQRMLGTLSSVPKLASRTIDQPWDAPHGHLSLHYKDSIPGDVLMRLPRRSLAFDVPPVCTSRGGRARARMTHKDGGLLRSAP
jgi:hypothetical protein